MERDIFLYSFWRIFFCLDFVGRQRNTYFDLVMIAQSIAVLVLILTIVAVESNEKCGVPVLNKNFSRLDFRLDESRLVGGKESQPHMWPWTGEILFNEIHQCGCALIDTSFAITAAHCFSRSRRTKNYTILLGGHQVYSGKKFKIKSIHIHPLYQIVANAYDLALIKIEPAAPINETITPICLPLLPVATNKVCVVTGWGRLRENGSKPRSLQEIHVPIIAPHVCNGISHYNGRVHTLSMMCAGYKKGKIDSCQGDSGGPLQCQNANGVWELQGIVSWGIGCAQPAFPGVYSKIFSMTGWIRSQLKILTSEKNRI